MTVIAEIDYGVDVLLTSQIMYKAIKEPMRAHEEDVPMAIFLYKQKNNITHHD